MYFNVHYFHFIQHFLIVFTSPLQSVIKNPNENTFRENCFNLKIIPVEGPGKKKNIVLFVLTFSPMQF